MSGMTPIYCPSQDGPMKCNTASPWWEKACLNVLDSGYFIDTSLVRRFNLFSDPTTAENAFHERQRQCSGSPPNSCGSNWESGAQEPIQEFKKIDDMLQHQNPLPAPTWDKARILSALASPIDATNIAEELDFYTWSKLCYLSFDSWARFTLGYDEPTVSKFVRDLSALRNDLAIRFQELSQPQVWILVGEASQERNPLLRWLLSSCISENESQSDPHAAISFILEPIGHLFSRETNGVIYVLKRLSILATRFQDGMRETTYNSWQRAFRNEFTFFDDINCNTPETYAASIVQADSKLFAGVSTSDLVRPNSQQLGLIGIVWSRLCSDVTASVNADYDLSVRISKVAVRLIFLGDYHSATAILTGLRHAGINREELSAFWHLVDMEDNYGAYREEVSNRRGRGPLILFAFPHVRELALRSDTTHPSFNLFQYVRFEGVERELEGRAALVLGCPTVVEERLKGKTDSGFDCLIATVEERLEGRTALDLYRPIATVEGEFGEGGFLNIDRPITTIGGGFEGGSFLGIQDLADNDTAFHALSKSSKHDDKCPAIRKDASLSTSRYNQMLTIKKQPKLSDLSNVWAVATLLSSSGAISPSQLKGTVFASAKEGCFCFPKLIVDDPGEYSIRVTLLEMKLPNEPFSDEAWLEGSADVYGFADSDIFVVKEATSAPDAPTRSLLTSSRYENSFYGHPEKNGQDFKERTACHATIAEAHLVLSTGTESRFKEPCR
ncbi:hypothetical protein VE00_01388 [Pseudogymnoascus sp. WSF 3629]|nr:hypothetical protein VE00_01388 [Pseudogymnoascus sp. WSF 3629]